MAKKYVFHLSPEERTMLESVIRKQDGTAMKVRRAHILLQADASGPCWTDAHIAEAYGCRTTTVARLRQRVVEDGVDAALRSKKEGVPAHNRLLNGEREAHIIAERLKPVPEGYANWSLRLLADRVVELNIVDSISHETVRHAIKKMD